MAEIQEYLEPDDSFFLGADVYYTYIVQNGWWELRLKQKTEEGYFSMADTLREKLLTGSFPEIIEEEFIHLLEYFGQSPVIVRSSSLQEDNFGNAFAGKYESVFCVNQGTPQERLRAFEDAIRQVYASTMSMDALQYRKQRGLAFKDEQMAILIQRVSGDYYGDYFFPHAAGVGNSSNLYVWDKNMDMDAGMLRLVFGLGTRAVDRVIGDYVKIVALDDPSRLPLLTAQDERKYSQHKADVLDLRNNVWCSKEISDLMKEDIHAYLACSEQDKYQIARDIGKLNASLKGENVLLMGPGRWGTTTPSLGVPVHFTEISNMAAMCEISYQSEGLMPELSYGSHFFQDLVESGVFYIALFKEQENVIFHEERLKGENLLTKYHPESAEYADVIKVIDAKGMELYSDICRQRVFCR